MKNKSIIIASIFFFLLLKTSFLWEKLPGLWDMGIMAVLITGFFILKVVLLVQLVLVIKYKFRNKEKNINTLVLAVVLLTSFLFPYGVGEVITSEEPNVIFAQYEGVANCTETLKIRKNRKFIHTSICFGVDEYKGTCLIVGDTIKLQYEDEAPFFSKLAHGIIKLDSTNSETDKGLLLYYRNLNDKKPIPLMIAQYDLNNIPIISSGKH